MTQPNFNSWQQRTALLLGEAGCARLHTAHVLVAGLGGVGGYAAEALARSGVGALTLVDDDLVQHSNRNRQLVALNSTVGRAKVEVMAERIADIHPGCAVTALAQRINAESIPSLLIPQYTAVVDAIDSLTAKLDLLAAAHSNAVLVASSMGAGGRSDPSALRMGDLMESRNCGLARAVRQGLRRRGIERGILAVWSEETAQPPASADNGQRIHGTLSYLPGLFGLSLAGMVIQRLLETRLR